MFYRWNSSISLCDSFMHIAAQYFYPSNWPAILHPLQKKKHESQDIIPVDSTLHDPVNTYINTSSKSNKYPLTSTPLYGEKKMSQYYIHMWTWYVSNFVRGFFPDIYFDISFPSNFLLLYRGGFDITRNLWNFLSDGV